MLTETLLTSLSAHHPKPSTAYPKDAAIFHHRLAPHPSQLSILKKSLTKANCLVASQTHIFAAQSDKAAIHVYNFDALGGGATPSGTLQTVVPFRHKITSLALAHDGLTVICGTGNGSLLVWETATGRVCPTAEAHLDAVTHIGVSASHTHVVSGGADGTLHVWSLGTILAFGDVGRSMESARRNPVRSLRGHKGAITGLAIGGADLVISIADDSSAVVWDLPSAARLRTLLLPGSATSLALDPCDRAVFFGFDDGSVAAFDFFRSTTESATHPLFDDDKHGSAIQISAGDKWKPPSDEVEAVRCLDVSYDSTKLISGHSSGRIVVWDVPSARFSSQLTLQPLPGPISNLMMLPVAGFSNVTRPLLKLKEVVKPRFGELEAYDGRMPENYKVTAQLVGDLRGGNAADAALDSRSSVLDDFAFPPDLLAESIAELAAWQAEKQQAGGRPSLDTDADFMALDGGEDAKDASLLAENAALKKQVKALQRMQKISFAQLEDMRSRQVQGEHVIDGSTTPLSSVQQDMDALRRANLEWTGAGGSASANGTSKKRARHAP